MISAIFNSPLEVKHVNRLPERTLTDAKIQKFVLGVLAAITFSISYLAFTVGGAALLLAIPTLVTGGVMTWIIIRMKDYQDPKKLQQYQTEAAQVDLGRTIRSHGWKNMFLHDIPQKGALNIRYREHVKGMTMPEIISLYEEGNAIRENLIKEEKCEQLLELPKPAEFRKQFDKEVANLSPIQIVNRYDLESLLKHDVISQALLDAKKTYIEAGKVYAEDKQKIEQAYQEKTEALTKEYTQQIPVNGQVPFTHQDYKQQSGILTQERLNHLERVKLHFEGICTEINQSFRD